MNLSISFVNKHLPDSIVDLFAMQRNLIRELNLKNKVYYTIDGEVSTLKRQNNLLKEQIEFISNLMDRLCSDKMSDAEAGFLGIA